MNLNSYLKDDNIFQAIQSLREFPFINDNVDELNMILQLEYGERHLFAPLENVDVLTAAKMVVTRFGKNWDRMLVVDALAENPVNRIVLTESGSENQNSSGDTSTTNKVSGYNSDELVTDSGSEGVSSEVKDLERSRTATTENIDVFKAYEVMTLSGRNVIIDLVIRDVAGFLSLSIY